VVVSDNDRQLSSGDHCDGCERITFNHPVRLMDVLLRLKATALLSYQNGNTEVSSDRFRNIELGKFNDENLPGFPGIPGFSSDFRCFPEWVLPIRAKKKNCF
jgi:hypothetical protein